MALEDRIKEARKNNGLTQQQAATMIGVAKSTWAGYESGNSTPDIDKIVKIMDVLGVDANYLWQDYNQEETKKAPAPEGAEEYEKVQMVVQGLTCLMVEAGWIAPGADLSDAQLRTLASYVIGLSAYFNSDL